MCRSSRCAAFVFASVAIGLLPSAVGAQVYGFPSEVGVVDDGFGTLPPAPPPLPAGFPPPELPPIMMPPQAPPPCPLIIKVGRGLRHPAKARVVYGRSAPCS